MLRWHQCDKSQGGWGTASPTHYCVASNTHPGSDIDLAVISQSFEDMGYWERIDTLSAAVYEVFEPIEAIALTPEEWENSDSLIADFARTGEAVG